MDRTTFDTTIDAAKLEGRVTAADLRDLRTTFEEMAAGRAEIEALVALDRVLAGADEAWVEFLAEMVVDAVVWSERPTGVVLPEAARWLAATFIGGEAGPSPSAGRVLVEVVRAAQAVDPALLEAAFAAPKGPTTAPVCWARVRRAPEPVLAAA